MKISRRAHAIAPFLAMEFGKQAAALEAAGHHVVKLNIGEPDFGAPDTVVRAMHAALEARHMAYTAALGIPSLREAIARHYENTYGVRVGAERIVVTAGASAALLLVTAALVDADDEVLVGDPSYPCNRHFLESFGARIKLVPTDASTRFQLSSDLIQEHWSDRTRGLMVATPSNPTGTSVPPHELAAICNWARARGAWRIVDEIYLGLSDHDVSGRGAPTVLSLDRDAIVINSFSKYFGMTGWRLGWCVLPLDLVPAVERLAQNYYICPSTPAQHAALACFTEEAIAVCESRRLELASRRSLVLAGLEQIGLSVPVPPDGAFYIYFSVKNTGLDAMTFCTRALAEAHVALTPGADFGKCSARDHVRLSYAASQNELREGLRRLGTFVGSLGHPSI
jgi:aspartate/methionine/tyrosine aminotransferase